MHLKKTDSLNKIKNLEKEKVKLNNKLEANKETLEKSTKKHYESTQNIKSQKVEIDNFVKDINRIKKDIEEYKKTSEKIFTELKKIESYELDLKIQEYREEIKNFNRIISSSDNNEELVNCSNKINLIIKGIKSIVETIQADEYELAKKNEQVKNDIDNKILNESNRLSELEKNKKIKNENILKLNEEFPKLENSIKNTELELLNINSDLNNLEENYSNEKNALYDIELNIETKKVRISNLKDNITLNNNELDSMSGNVEILKTGNDLPDDKLLELEKSLSKNLKIQNTKDLELKEDRIKITELTNKISKLEEEKSEISTFVENIRHEISEDEKSIQEVVGQVKNIKEQLEELGMNNKSILEADINYDLTKWKKRESELSSAIDRMGPINLAAIDQFKEYEERKSYLTMQKDDLLAALNSLEEAIKKIDKETKDRFKDTFEKVNNKLQEIFPKLFNGGKAYLKMTENDLLKTGVEVYASPPGKKLTSINLLSGGEKALTALSLVFALFSLNPSPFCMLDEVDAPLDDINIERFCDLFTEMSEKIQFIVITHKKITMEYVEQLIGVTMGEKGVSKLVNVSMQDQL